MRYFDHDTTAASDDLIMALRLEHGGAAVDCYWAIIEQIYRDEQPAVIAENQPGTKALSVRLAIAYQVLETYVNTMISYGLLYIVENSENGCMYVTSKRAEENIKAYQAKCEKARLNGAKGGNKTKRKAKANQRAKQTLSGSGSDSQAKKRKEKKDIGYLYGNQISSATDGAAVESTTPPVAPKCLMCGTDLECTGMADPEYWWCQSCKEFFPTWKAAS